MNEYNYKEHVALLTAEDLMNLEQQLKEPFLQWLRDRTEADIQVAGFSATKLMQEKGMTFPSALVALDWLIKEPDVAKNELSKDIIR